MTTNGSVRRSAKTTKRLSQDASSNEPIENNLHEVFRPVHSAAESYLTSSTGFTNYRGVINLCIVLLVLSNARVAIENLLKYGILFDPLMWLQWMIGNPYQWPCIMLCFLSNLYILAAYVLELSVYRQSISEQLCRWLHIFNLLLVLIMPAVAILYVHPFPWFSANTLLVHSCIFLKLWSYMVVNQWCRQKMLREAKQTKSKGGELKKATDLSACSDNETPTKQQYPDNLNLRDLYYFMLAPTLCYELNFPRLTTIRKRFLLKRIAETVILFQVMSALVQQWLVPMVENSMEPMKQMHVSRLVERLLKLAVPNLLVWIIWFYWYFHSCMNFLAEIMLFADREFYRDWWNAESVSYFWQNWNIPVHRWASRHMYRPLIGRGFTRFQAAIAVFLLSALFHEYLISIPLRMFRIWVFVAMMGQVPYALMVSRYLHGAYGNMAVWMSLILGQPMAILIYWHDYYVSLSPFPVSAILNATQS